MNDTKLFPVLCCDKQCFNELHDCTYTYFHTCESISEKYISGNRIARTRVMHTKNIVFIDADKLPTKSCVSLYSVPIKMLLVSGDRKVHPKWTKKI